MKKGLLKKYKKYLCGFFAPLSLITCYSCSVLFPQSQEGRTGGMTSSEF